MPDRTVRWSATVEVVLPDGTTKYVDTTVDTNSRRLEGLHAKVAADLETDALEVRSIVEAAPLREAVK